MPDKVVEPRKRSWIGRFLDRAGDPLGERRSPTYHQEEIVGRTREGYPHHVLVDEDGGIILSPEGGVEDLKNSALNFGALIKDYAELAETLTDKLTSAVNTLEHIEDRSGFVYSTPHMVIPGIGTGVTYTSADAFGGMFAIPVPKETGIISSVIFLDKDDEGISKEIVLFSEAFTATADNSAFAVSDDDLKKCIGVISVDVFYNYGNNQVAVVSPALGFYAPNLMLWGQFVTRGADNIAAGSIPEVVFVITE